MKLMICIPKLEKTGNQLNLSCIQSKAAFLKDEKHGIVAPVLDYVKGNR